MEKAFTRDLDALGDVFEFIDSFVASHTLDPPVQFALNLAIEELFTNMVRHNEEGSDDIAIHFEKEGSQVVVTMMDFDSTPYDLTEHGAVDINAPLEERKVGGLGIHLVKRMMDEVYYEYKDGQTKIKLVKTLIPTHA